MNRDKSGERSPKTSRRSSFRRRQSLSARWSSARERWRKVGKTRVKRSRAFGLRGWLKAAPRAMHGKPASPSCDKTGNPPTRGSSTSSALINQKSNSYKVMFMFPRCFQIEDALLINSTLTLYKKLRRTVIHACIYLNKCICNNFRRAAGYHNSISASFRSASRIMVSGNFFNI
jgi:hypothetical protein